MPEKYFLVSAAIDHLSKEAIENIEKSNIALSQNIWRERELNLSESMNEECNLKCVNGRVVVRVNMEYKNNHTFANGLTIRRERAYNDFNRRVTQPINSIVIDAENIPKGSEILINHNALHDTNRIFDYESNSPDIKYFSIKEDECYAWRIGKEDYKPMPNFEFGMRCYLPYEGNLIGIQPKFLENCLYVTSGELKGKIVRTLKASDYQIIFQGDNGQEQTLIRFRHSEDENFEREEVVGIANDLTELYYKGLILVGISPNDAKTC